MLSSERIRERLAEESFQWTAKQVGRVDGSHAVQNRKKRSFLLFYNGVGQVYLKDKWGGTTGVTGYLSFTLVPSMFLMFLKCF